MEHPVKEQPIPDDVRSGCSGSISPGSVGCDIQVEEVSRKASFEQVIEALRNLNDAVSGFSKLESIEGCTFQDVNAACSPCIPADISVSRRVSLEIPGVHDELSPSDSFRSGLRSNSKQSSKSQLQSSQRCLRRYDSNVGHVCLRPAWNTNSMNKTASDLGESQGAVGVWAKHTAEFDNLFNAVKNRRKSSAIVGRLPLMSPWWYQLCSIVFHPASPFRLAWNVACFFIIAYDLVMLPMQAFGLGDDIGFQIIDWMWTLFWTVDVVVSFRTGYITDTTVVMAPKQIALNYTRTWMMPDVLIVMFEWLARCSRESLTGTRGTKAIKVARFVKVARVIKIARTTGPIMEQINSNTFHLCSCICGACFLLMLTIHIVACCWYAVGESSPRGWTSTDMNAPQTEAVANNVAFLYLSSVRWVLAQLNGRTDMVETRTMEERGFTCLVTLCLSVIAKSAFTGLMTKTLIDIGAASSRQAHRRQMVNEYCICHKVSAKLTARLKKWSKSSNNNSKSEAEKEAEILAFLPRELGSCLAFEVRAALLTRQKFFYTMNTQHRQMLFRICQVVVRTTVVDKFEMVFDKCDACNRMIFIERGKLRYHDGEEEYGSEKTITSSENEFRSERSAGKDVANGHTAVGAGIWLCEPSLWVEWWNRHRLTADVTSTILKLASEEMSSTLCSNEDAFAFALQYAWEFAEQLGELDEAEWTDLPSIVPKCQALG